MSEAMDDFDIYSHEIPEDDGTLLARRICSSHSDLQDAVAELQRHSKRAWLMLEIDALNVRLQDFDLVIDVRLIEKQS